MYVIIRKDIDCLKMTLISIICLFYITLHEEKTYKKKAPPPKEVKHVLHELLAVKELPKV